MGNCATIQVGNTTSGPVCGEGESSGTNVSIGNAEALLTWLNGVRHLYTIDKGKPVRRMRKLLNRGI